MKKGVVNVCEKKSMSKKEYAKKKSMSKKEVECAGNLTVTDNLTPK